VRLATPLGTAGWAWHPGPPSQAPAVSSGVPDASCCPRARSRGDVAGHRVTDGHRRSNSLDPIPGTGIQRDDLRVLPNVGLIAKGHRRWLSRRHGREEVLHDFRQALLVTRDGRRGGSGDGAISLRPCSGHTTQSRVGEQGATGKKAPEGNYRSGPLAGPRSASRICWPLARGTRRARDGDDRFRVQRLASANQRACPAAGDIRSASAALARDDITRAPW
jgi:hypothetical protein